MSISPGTLYVVATPIGNLDDFSLRARRILSTVDFIAAEDTRHSSILLKAFDITGKERISLHEHNEAEHSQRIVARLLAGETGALISDAGTPLVSDPGFRLVRAVQAENLALSPIPGASAVTAALSVAGMATDRFAFEGFLPARATARRKRLAALAEEARTLVFYEAPHRLVALLSDCVELFGGDREAALARELTKIHESIRRAPLEKILHRLTSGEEPARGECVVLIAGAPERASGYSTEPLLKALLAEGLSPSVSAGIARRLSRQPHRRLYRRALELSRELRQGE